MSDQKPLNLSNLTVGHLDVVPTDSLDSTAHSHGMPELAASCALPECASGTSLYLPEDWDWADA